MINLLPPGVKEESLFAKRNAMLLHYIWLMILLAVVCGAIFGAGAYYISQQKTKLQKEIAAKNAQISTFKGLENDAKDANSRLKAFKTLSGNQARFSSLLSDLASHTPKGVSISTITLTGDANQAVKISATATSTEAAASLRDALAKSPRIKEVAIDDISTQEAGGLKVNVTVAFKPGSSK